MEAWISIYIITVAHLFAYCNADVHSFGSKQQYETRIYNRTIINDVNKVPKDYTIIYRSVGFKYQDISYLKIDVNVESTGYVNGSNYNALFDAKVQIKNALNVTVTIEIYVSRSSEISSVLKWTNDVQKDVTVMNRYFYKSNDKYHGESIAFVYKKNSNTTLKAKPYAQNAIGRRQKADELLHFEIRNVTNVSRFPSRAFQYSGNAYITYVGFSFNSPTAIAMINTSFVGEQEFNAVAYDRNTEHFVANMSVYGIKSAFRPATFEGLI